MKQIYLESTINLLLANGMPMTTLNSLLDGGEGKTTEKNGIKYVLIETEEKLEF